MAVKDIVSFGFGPSEVKFIPTFGFGFGAVVTPPTIIFLGSNNIHRTETNTLYIHRNLSHTRNIQQSIDDAMEI